MTTLEKLSAEVAHPIIIFQTDGDELPQLRPLASYPPPIPMPAPGFPSAFSIGDIFSMAVKSKATIYAVIPGIRLVGLSSTQQLEGARKFLEAQDAAGEKLRPEAYKKERALRERKMSDEQWQNYAAMILWTQQALLTLSQVTGGWADFLEQTEQAGDIYKRILSDINNRYIIGYQPVNKARDGKLRRVNVDVRGHAEYIVFGRKVYYAQLPQ
jgi:hypothetical protein